MVWPSALELLRVDFGIDLDLADSPLLVGRSGGCPPDLVRELDTTDLTPVVEEQRELDHHGGLAAQLLHLLLGGLARMFPLVFSHLAPLGAGRAAAGSARA